MKNLIIVTGGAGFIGGALVRKLLRDTDVQIFNFDKFGYASDLTSINNEIKILGNNFNKNQFVIIDFFLFIYKSFIWIIFS